MGSLTRLVKLLGLFAFGSGYCMINCAAIGLIRPAGILLQLTPAGWLPLPAGLLGVAPLRGIGLPWASHWKSVLGAPVTFGLMIAPMGFVRPKASFVKSPVRIASVGTAPKNGTPWR